LFSENSRQGNFPTISQTRASFLAVIDFSDDCAYLYLYLRSAELGEKSPELAPGRHRYDHRRGTWTHGDADTQAPTADSAGTGTDNGTGGRETAGKPRTEQGTEDHEPLSHNLYMLAALEHMGKSDDDIMAIMGLNLGAFRTTRTRLNQKRRSS